MTRPWILIADDDRGVAESLTALLERNGRTIVLCSDVLSAEFALARYPITHVVSDVQFTGVFGYEGLHFLTRIRAGSDARIVLMTGGATDQLRSEAMSHGASALLQKPFDGQTIEQALALDEPDASDLDECEVIRFPSIEEVLTGGDLSIAFQPIVRLTANGATPFAFEALTRVSGRWLKGGPAALFDYASRHGRLTDLNILTMKKAIAAATELPVKADIFLNLDPLAFERADLAKIVVESLREAGIDSRRLILEVTERSAFQNEAIATTTFAELRAAGIRLALDDHGSAYSHLALIAAIQPSFVKISQEFGTDFELDESRHRIVRHIVGLSADFGSETIIEGVETEETAAAAVGAQVGLAQGYFFGRPQAASHWASAMLPLCAA
jgi:EAL domain-containing protein (putative c-di-GMP-specific phosphodiesterase class I)